MMITESERVVRMQMSMAMERRHFFRAGARIARTGGANAEQTCITWCRENMLNETQVMWVWSGFRAEVRSNPTHKPGVPLGGKR